jgi:nucleotide-binding universal stress UspA family protein
MNNAPSVKSKATRKDESFRLKTILAPVDFSEDAMRAFRYAAHLAETSGGKVIVLNVVENPLVYPAFSAGDQERIAGETQRKLYQACQAEPAISDEVETMVRIGVESVAEEIALAARDVAADLIVLPARHRASLGRAFFANTGDKIARHAPCPVLRVPVDQP